MRKGNKRPTEMGLSQKKMYTLLEKADYLYNCLDSNCGVSTRSQAGKISSNWAQGKYLVRLDSQDAIDGFIADMKNNLQHDRMCSPYPQELSVESYIAANARFGYDGASKALMFKDGSFVPATGNSQRFRGRSISLISGNTLNSKRTIIDQVKKISDPNRSWHLDRFEKNNSATTKKFRVGLLIEPHPEHKDGIVIWEVQATIDYKNGGDAPVVSTRVITYAECSPGNVKCWHKYKDGDYEVDPRMCFLTWNTYNTDFYVLYDGTDMVPFTLYEFVEKMDLFCNRTGVSELLVLSDYSGNFSFLYYLYIYGKYPVLEQLMKMGMWKMMREIINEMLRSNKADIRPYCDEITSLFNENSRRGLDGLRTPAYITQYLRDRNAGVKEVAAWCDMYIAENYSKDNFMKAVHSREFGIIESIGITAIEDLAKCVSGGYELLKLLPYIVKQAVKNRTSISMILNNIKDYVEMCTNFGITIDYYPANIIMVHNNIINVSHEKENAMYDEKILHAANSVRGALSSVRDTVLLKESEFDIVMPQNSHDIINEGQNNHNCVGNGSYARAMAAGNDIIFFLRRKDALDKSYITCEYRNGALAQCYRAHNAFVDHNSTEYRIAEQFCKYIADRKTAKTAA